MYNIRFHLAKGKNYMKWQVRYGKNVRYYDPNHYQLELDSCKLINKTNKAKRVNNSGKKEVSGWITCKHITITNNVPIDDLEKLYYNPIRDPHWRRESDCNEFIWDDSEYSTLVTNGKQVYILEERT